MTTSTFTEARARKIGATDVPKILGISPFGDPLQVWARIRGEAPPVETNAFMRWGLATEAMHAEIINARGYYKVTPNRDVVVHPTLPFLCCTHDGDAEALVTPRDGNGAWEAKAPIWDTWEDGLPPSHYLIQNQVQMLVLGRSWGLASRLMPPKSSTSELVECWEVDADPALHARILERVSEWWQRHIVEGRVPLEGASLESVKSIWPNAQETATRISDAALAAWGEAQVLGDQIKELDARRDALRGRVAVEIGPHAYGVGSNDCVISHKTQTRKSYVVAESTYRTLRTAKSLPAGIPIVPNPLIHSEQEIVK